LVTGDPSSPVWLSQFSAASLRSIDLTDYFAIVSGETYLFVIVVCNLRVPDNPGSFDPHL
jgi:hypothetical protein